MSNTVEHPLVSISQAKRILTRHTEKDALNHVIENLDEDGRCHDLVLAWDAIKAFKYPMAYLSESHVSMIYFLNEGYDKVQVIDCLVNLAEQKTEEPNVYLHLARELFEQDKSEKARAVLKKGIENSYDTVLIKLYYCQKLKPSVVTSIKTFESMLLPVLSEEERTPGAKFCASILLLCHYLATKNFLAAKKLQHDYGSFFNSDSLITQLVQQCIDDDGLLNEPSQNYFDWAMAKQNAFWESAPESVTPESHSIYDFERATLLSDLFGKWINERESFKDFVDSFERENGPIRIEIEESDDTPLLAIFLSLYEVVAEENKPFWALMAICSNDKAVLHMRDMGGVINALYDEFGFRITGAARFQYICAFGDRKDYQDSFVGELYQAAKELIFEGEGDLTDEWMYKDLVIAKPSSASRPIPYWLSTFEDGLKRVNFPNSFYEGLWNSTFRGHFTSNNIGLRQELAPLLEIFIERIPNGDPLFVKGWLLSEEGKDAQAFQCFKTLYDQKENIGYSLLRNLSYCAGMCGDHEAALEFEQEAHDNPVIQVPDDRVDLIDVLKRKVDDHKAKQEQVTKDESEKSHFYSPNYDCTVNVDQLSLLQTAKLIALIENFHADIEKSKTPLFGREKHWLPGADASYSGAISMINKGAAYLSKSLDMDGLDRNGDGFTPDFNVIGITPNIEGGENWNVVLGSLYQRIEKLKSSMTETEIESATRSIMVEELVQYAKERFDAYNIKPNKKVKYEETANHCLDLFSLKQCIGIFHHEIEDAAARQREVGMTDTHAINSGLSSARSRATRAYEADWNMRDYDRSRNANPTSFTTDFILEHILINDVAQTSPQIVDDW